MIAAEQKMLTFALNKEHYGVFIQKVKEIIGMVEITKLPQSPDFIKGVINLRGIIIPVLDLRLKFSMEAIPYDERTCIIIMQVTINGKEKLLGVIVDSVSEVINISSDDIEESIDYGSNLDTDFIVGIGKIKEKVLILLDIDKIINCKEIIAVFEK